MSDELYGGGFSGDVPAVYDAHLGPVLFEGYARNLALRAAALGASRVLELAAGTGISSRALRDALDPSVSITVTDLNNDMLDVARAKFGPDENVTFVPADAMSLAFEDGAFDLLVCQFGVMFVPDKVEAFREARRVLAPGGTFLFNSWRSLQDNSPMAIAHAVIGALYPENPPAFYTVPFSYCDGAAVSADLTSAGFDGIAHETVSQDSSIEDWRHIAHGMVFGTPMAAEIVQRGVHDPQAVAKMLADALRDHYGETPTALPFSAMVFTGRNPAEA